MKKATLFLSLLAVLSLSCCTETPNQNPNTDPSRSTPSVGNPTNPGTANPNPGTIDGTTTGTDNTTGNTDSTTGTDNTTGNTDNTTSTDNTTTGTGNTDNSTDANTGNTTGTDSTDTNNTDNTSTTGNDTTDTEDETDDWVVKYITISERQQDLFLDSTKTIYLTVDFFGENGEVSTDDLHENEWEGSWSSSNESIVKVHSVTGKLMPQSVGRAIVTYTVTASGRSANCVIDVYQSSANFVKEYQKVTDFESFSDNDVVVFGCPQQGIAATLDRLDGALKSVTTTFSSDGNKITSLGEGVGTYVLTSKEIDTDDGTATVFTLQNQNGKYLNAKNFKNVNFVNDDKAESTLWAFESGYVYPVAGVEGWLMFNTKSDRFTLYDSNEQVDMFLPSIYRLTTIKQ